MVRSLVHGIRASISSRIILGVLILTLLAILVAPPLLIPRQVKACNTTYYSLNVSWTNGGTVTWTPHAPFKAGTRVRLTATPSTRFVFDHWGGDASGTSNPISIVMDRDKTVIAYFVSTTFCVLTVNVSGSGSVNPPGGTYRMGTQVTLMAKPGVGWFFDHWSGDASGTSTRIIITMDSDKTVAAQFYSNQMYSLTVTSIGGGTTDPLSGMFRAPLVATITAIPDAGYQFDHWGGDASGTSNPISILMDTDKTVIAYFVSTTFYTLTVNVSGSGTVDPVGGTYRIGTQVTLTATPNTGWFFAYWLGDASGAFNPIVITMDSNKTVTAQFLSEQMYSLTVTSIGGGTTDPLSGMFRAPLVATITAIPDAGYQFDHWEGDASGTSSAISIVMDSDKTVIAVFVLAS